MGAGVSFVSGVSVEMPPFVEGAVGAHAASNIAQSMINFIDMGISFPKRTLDSLELFLMTCRSLRVR